MATNLLRDGCVYFIAKRGAVKVGYTTQLGRRMMTLATASSEPLRLVGAVPGDRALEVHCHEQLAPHRLYGEWFRRKPALALLDLLSGTHSVIHDGNAWKRERDPTSISREAATYRRRLRETEAELAQVRAELDVVRGQLSQQLELGHYQLTLSYDLERVSDLQVSAGRQADGRMRTG